MARSGLSFVERGIRDTEANTGAIEMAIADGEGGEDEISDGSGLHPPHAKADDGHTVAAAQGDRLRHGSPTATAARCYLGFTVEGHQ